MGVAVEDLVVEFALEGELIRAVDHITFEANAGEIVALLGPSGCGKTTTLSCLAGILTPTSGTIRISGNPLSGDLVEHRRTAVGIVFQAFNLVPSMTARENVALPLLAAGEPTRRALARADELLELVGLSDRAGHPPQRLSGGQQQRVAIARALAHDPPVLLADEPTANLDYVQADAIIRLLRDLRARGRAIIISTHDDRVIPIADRVVRMVTDHVGDEFGPGRHVYAAGESIFRQGDRGELAYVVESGEVEILRATPAGDEVVATVEPGNYFGELAPLTGFPRSASARARVDTVLNAYTIHDFRTLILEEGIAQVPTEAPAAPPAVRTRRKKKTAAAKKTVGKKRAKAKAAPAKKRAAGRRTGR